MADELPTEKAILRREALLPGERNRGLGTVAVVCTMAGVASGLALATTLMAMQVADSMSSRSSYCSRSQIDVPPDQNHGFLGISGDTLENGAVRLTTVVANSPADVAHFRLGDVVVVIDHSRIHGYDDLHNRFYYAMPGSTHSVVVVRDGTEMELHPTLVALPARFAAQ
ncbi:MAG TPA: PDZ domain-containing protein [Kofleriaceae bacterium]|jgi:S1-C subfamily serine protease